MTDIAAFVRGLPKAELHLHIEGALEPELMLRLGERNKTPLPFSTIEEARAAYAFGDLQDFLDLYYAGAAVLLRPEDFRELVLAYLERARADGVRHVELFFDPQTHTGRGVPFGAVMEGLLAGLEEGAARLGLTFRLILSFLRHLDERAAFETLAAAHPWLDRIDGVGLDSTELGNPPSKFRQVFKEAERLGLRRTAHAGEEGPSGYVQEALDLLKAERIDHGNRALEDPLLVARLAREKVCLTVCPLSNLKLCVVEDLRAHPLRKMLDLGLRATVNSDDPAYFGGYVLENYVETARALDLSEQDLVTLARNSFTGSFLSEKEVSRGLAAIDLYLAGQGLEG